MTPEKRRKIERLANESPVAGERQAAKAALLREAERETKRPWKVDVRVWVAGRVDTWSLKPTHITTA